MKFTTSIILLFLTGISYGLQLTSLQVPNWVDLGSTAALECRFDLQQDVLYSIKWYKDGEEFFRYVRTDSPQIKDFYIGDIEVDMSRSSKETVFLMDIALSAEGTYRCEVSTDAPSSQTVSAEKFMAVEDESYAMNFSSSLGPTASWLLLLILILCH